ncbi:MAG TPA: hypothetical protein VF062_12380 [Candidatus Limnocylindrales bacterium]
MGTEEEVKSYLDGCAAIASLSLKCCPIKAGSASPVRNIRWRIVSYPPIDVLVRSDLTMALQIRGSGTAEVTGVYPDGMPLRFQDQFAAHGVVKEIDGKLIWQPLTLP